jgi:glycine/D-amino acid oxidase-like deaminating enzyme/nitrite reductase/ring-hydroxylating ferredoxin subunit
MQSAIPGKPISVWLDTTPSTNYPPLPSEIRADICVIGAGIAGLTAAQFLSAANADVVLIEKEAIASAVTGNTTGKITSLHTLIYHDLIERFGLDKANAYGESNQWAIRHIADQVRELSIDCDFVEDDAYTYAFSETGLGRVHLEVEAAQKIGLPAEFAGQTSLPLSMLGAIKFGGQARFHPRRYLLRIAEEASKGSCRIYEHTRAIKLVEEDGGWAITTTSGMIRCSKVLLLTHYPIFDPAMYFARLFPQRAYALAARVASPLPEGMHISCDEPERSVRRLTVAGEELLIFGGEVHKVGQEEDTAGRYQLVAAWASKHFAIDEFLYHWSTQDNSTADGLPYIGQASQSSTGLYFASGFNGWGMTLGTVAGKLLSDLALGIKNPWAELYDPCRSELKGAGTFIKEGLNVANELIGGKIHGAEHLTPDQIKDGQAKVLTTEKGHAAAYRDQHGKLHCVSATCTHMGCTLRWNTAEKSWDCPCHGSRFSPDGKVLHGPAVMDLEPIEL